MIQARCPECGFVQTLSEKKFLSISDDFLECPHCHDQIPKYGVPFDADSVPDDDKRKMDAYANRIISSPQISPEIIYALETLVKRHGPMEGNLKALGIGCARLGELEKATQYLYHARHEDPMDKELPPRLLEVLLNRELFAEAEKMGEHIIEAQGSSADPTDVARLILAHIGAGHIDKAQALLVSRPDLDSTHPFLKRARKQLNKASGANIVSLLGGFNPFERFISLGRKTGLTSITDRATRFIRNNNKDMDDLSQEEQFQWLDDLELDDTGPRAEESVHEAISKIEYWIYCRDTQLPKWEAIKNAYEEEIRGYDNRKAAITKLNRLIDDGSLKIDNFLKTEAEHLFDPPSEFVRETSRGAEDRDFRTLAESRMLVRVRLSCPAEDSLENLGALVHLVEAIRRLTAGIVQDVVSHTLWGVLEWREHVVLDPKSDPLDKHIRLDTLDEGAKVWIHTHGMQKFGYPEFEMEEIPSELTSTGQKMTMLLADTLLNLKEPLKDFNTPVKIPGAPFLVAMKLRPPDDEGHFPVGSMRAMPFVTDYDPESPDTIKHTLRMFAARLRANEPAPKAAVNEASSIPPDSNPAMDNTDKTGEEAQTSDIQSDTESPQTSDHRANINHEPETRPQQPDIRSRLLQAHKEARMGLFGFKERFNISPAKESEIYAVKVGFPSPTGAYEWMWLSLEEWRDESIVGRLQNTPSLRKDLEVGAPVSITEEEIFDWAVISRDQGLIQGAFTESIMSNQRESIIN